VSRRILIFVAIVATLLIAVSPLIECFDTWDNIPATGNDTELTFFVIGVCIGLCFVMAMLLVRLVVLVFSLVVRLSSEMASTSRLHAFGTDYLRLLFSPPLSLSSLRI